MDTGSLPHSLSNFLQQIYRDSGAIPRVLGLIASQLSSITSEHGQLQLENTALIPLTSHERTVLTESLPILVEFLLWRKHPQYYAKIINSFFEQVIDSSLILKSYYLGPLLDCVILILGGNHSRRLFEPKRFNFSTPSSNVKGFYI